MAISRYNLDNFDTQRNENNAKTPAIYHLSVKNARPTGRFPRTAQPPSE